MMTMQQYGMSTEFTKWSPGAEPMFIKEGEQIFQNPKCQVSGSEFIKKFVEFSRKKKK